ncbi:N-6 DNA methylase [Rhodoferax sp.]|uniref:N-6 DNA methylase n=1 Tax=Rhodoferax sp. TaxID=50421 RepID=UPI002749D8F0|nr:N-6 DNA methylase [Rhodoferax sp.]
MIKLLQANCGRHQLHTVFSDFVEMAALAYANAVDMRQRPGREKRYLEIVARYTREQVSNFTGALASLTMALECAGFADVLGTAFMELELGSKWAGQFFTPYSVCQLMAGVNMVGLPEKVKAQGFVTCCDPAVGAGALPIAFAEAMYLAGHNYQHCLHVTAQDVDARAAHMAFVQLSLLHVPAVVIVGNSLSGERREVWYTPAHVMGGWSRRLNRQQKETPPAEPAARAAAPVTAPLAEPEMLGLFD